MTEIEFRRVYCFRLAFDLLQGFIAPRGYEPRNPSRHRAHPQSPEYTNAKECHAYMLLRPFGLSPRTNLTDLRALYSMYDEELAEELKEMWEQYRHECRERADARREERTTARQRAGRRVQVRPEEVGLVWGDTIPASRYVSLSAPEQPVEGVQEEDGDDDDTYLPTYLPVQSVAPQQVDRNGRQVARRRVAFVDPDPFDGDEVVGNRAATDKELGRVAKHKPAPRRLIIRKKRPPVEADD